MSSARARERVRTEAASAKRIVEALTVENCRPLLASAVESLADAVLSLADICESLESTCNARVRE